MRLPTLTDIGKGEALFQWYSDGVLRYRIVWTDLTPGDSTFDVDIPIEDAGGGHFTPTMKGLNVLRWARKHLELIKEAQSDKAQEV